jgi:membrane protein
LTAALDQANIFRMQTLRALWRFARRVGRRFIADACPGRAAGLAFSTLFALVPLTAFVVAVLSTFGAFDPLIEGAQQALIQQLVPAVHEEVFDGVREFAANTRALGFFGFFIFLITAVILLRNIHVSLNAIWQYRTRRGVWAAVASYTSVIVIGTTLLSASFAVGPIVQSVVTSALPDTAQASWLRTYLLPPVFLYAALFSIYILVPAGKVRAASSALGAGVAVIIWEVAKRIFVFWSTSVMRLNVIYGSLAVLPIFLIWLYLTWFFILIGVEVAYVFSHRHDYHDIAERDTSKPVSELLGLCYETALEVFLRYRDGEPGLTRDALDSRLGKEAAEAVRLGLSQSGLILDTDQGLLPARSLDSITVGQLVRGVASADGQRPVSDDDSLPDSRVTVGRLLALSRSEPDLPVSTAQVLGR